MVSNRIALAVLAAACVTAAGAGGYLAMRQKAALAEAPAAAAPLLEPTATVSGPVPAVAPIAAEPAQPRAETGAAPQTAARARPAAAERREIRTLPAAATTGRAEAPAQRGDQPAVSQNASSGGTAEAASPPLQPSPDSVTFEGSAPPAYEGDRAIETPAAPAERVQQELIIAADSVIGLRLESAITTARARIEDRVEARVIRDVRSGSDVVIPAGSQALGSVTAVDRGGKFKERARLGIRFHTLVLADGSRLPITTETLYRFGESPGNGSAARIGGGAVAGAILGAVLGGAKGAAVGATAGAGAGTAVVMAGDRNEAEFPAGAELTARILAPVAVAVER